MMKRLDAKIYSTDSIFIKNVESSLLLDEHLSLYNSNRFTIFPGFCDVHVHFREPGFSYKGTIESESMAAAHCGYTAVCTMPNLNPVPDSLEHLQVEQDLIDKYARISVYPFGSLTKEEKGKELSDIAEMHSKVCGFSDDGKGVQNETLMKEAMMLCKQYNKVLSAHCEVESLVHGGYIHDGEYARNHGHKGICSESEWKEVERDILLAKETGCAYHVCHISTKESVELIRQAKKDGIAITCETAPHYLIFTDADLQEDARWKMYPPIRSKEDKLALIEGYRDGTIDCLATDHAPHSVEEKSRGLKNSANGIIGLETAFPAVYTYLIKTGEVSLERVIDSLVYAPRKIFSIPVNPNDFTIYDLEEEYIIDSDTFLSKARSTPFDGMNVFGKCVATIHDGNIVWEESK